MTPPNILVLSIGNEGRRDDGLGHEFGRTISKSHAHLFQFEERTQLNVEDALLLSRFSVVLFLDAGHKEANQEPYSFTQIAAAASIEFSTHAMRPETVLALCAELYSAVPLAYLLAIAGEDWAIGEGLSQKARSHLSIALNEFDKTISQLLEFACTKSL